ncbi:MAG: CNNM domain-containing protein [Planctomycetota bacterium]|nr:CNNM domain-containing protein [Planctomycetota bacterium]
MSLELEIFIIVLCILGTAIFAGAETAFYRASRVRLDMEARAGSRAAQIVQRLGHDRTQLVIVFVLGVSLCLEVMTWRTEAALHARGFSNTGVELFLSLLLVPFVFFVAELFPKDLCRRRPHAALRFTAPIVEAVRLLLWPLVQVLAVVARAAARAAGGAGDLDAGVQGREAVLGFLREGTQSGAIPGHAEEMARNVLKLRSIPVERCMVAWKDVVRLDADAAPDDHYDAVAASAHTRIPVADRKGLVLGYVHQLDVLGDGESRLALDRLRPLTSIPPDLPVDRALARLRAAGQRLAIVGTREAPVGIVTLKDLLEEISGDLARW